MDKRVFIAFVMGLFPLMRAAQREKRGMGEVSYYGLREWYTHNFAWAVPTYPALRRIARFSHYRIVEIGAGSGLWAFLLTNVMRCKVWAYDSLEWEFSSHYYDVRQGGPEKAADHPDATLLLCWPPFESPMAYQAVKAFKGNRIIYIGEGRGGCTGDNKFHRLLEMGWERKGGWGVPQWEGIHDHISFYERKLTPEPLCHESPRKRTYSPYASAWTTFPKQRERWRTPERVEAFSGGGMWDYSTWRVAGRLDG